MITPDDVVRDMMNYFAATGANARRTYTLRDFNAQVMMNAYAPEERECLGLALARLADEGILQPVAPMGYELTEKGAAGVRAIRESRLAPRTRRAARVPAPVAQ